MREGGVHLAMLPQADGREKLRPVVLLRQFPRHGDFLACGVSTQLDSADPAVDVVIREADADFSESGLRETSVIRLSHIYTLPEHRVRGQIGGLSGERVEHLCERLIHFLR